MFNRYSYSEDFNARAANRRAHDIKEMLADIYLEDKPHFNAGYWSMMKVMASLAAPPVILGATGIMSAGPGLLVGLPAAAYFFMQFYQSTKPREALTEERNALVVEFNRLKKQIKAEVPDARWNDDLVRFTSRRNPKALEY